MKRISRKASKKLVKAYEAFLKRALEGKETNLTLDERKAIGQKVLDDILEASFKKLDVPEDEQGIFREEFETLIRKKFPESLLDTPLMYTGKGYQSKN